MDVAMVLALNSASVACTSAAGRFEVVADASFDLTHAPLKYSKPVLFGAGRAKYGSLNISASNGSDTLPLRAQLPPSSNG